MPLYEYYCPDCGRDFEKMMRFDQADEKPVCPTCAGKRTQKKLSLFSSKGSAADTSLSGGCGSGRGGFT